MNTMDIQQEITARLTSLRPLQCHLQDDSHLHSGHAGARAGGGHYQLKIISQSFAGVSTVSRHRLIYKALGDLMQTRIHALSIQALSPEEATRS